MGAEQQASHRLGARLLALNLRLEELDRELHQTRVRTLQLEARVDDARLAHLLGEQTESMAHLGSELERLHQELESGQALLDRLRDSQRQARIDYSLARMRLRRVETESTGAPPAPPDL